MKRRLMTCVLLGALILCPGLLFGADGLDMSEPFDNGRIDWCNGTVWAEGIHAPKEKGGRPLSPEEREYYVSRAVAAARSNLTAILKKLTIHGETTGGDLMSKNRDLLAQLDLMFLSTPVTGKRFLSDGSVEVTVTFPLRGAFSQLLLPGAIRQIDPIKPLFQTPKPKRVETHASYTGLIVDARGINARPGLAPRVVSESGDEVYGPTVISREHAVQRGVATYESTLTQAGQGLLAGENPLMVTGIGTTTGARTDIVISSQDAARIRADVAHTAFLSKCRVVIVLDGPASKSTPGRRTGRGSE